MDEPTTVVVTGAFGAAKAVPGDRPGNLFSPVDDLHVTRGAFDRQAENTAISW